MSLLEMNVRALAVIAAVFALLVAVASLGSCLEESDKASGECVAIETLPTKIHYRCKDGRDFWRVNKGQAK